MGAIQERIASGLTEQYLAAAKEMGDRNGLNACDKRLDSLQGEVEGVMREITYIPATSAAGLRVKTMAAIEVNGHLWDEPLCDLDYNQGPVRSVIEAACVVTGIPVPQEELGEFADDDAVGLHLGSAALNCWARISMACPARRFLAKLRSTVGGSSILSSGGPSCKTRRAEF
jgi:hypothetical protein